MKKLLIITIVMSVSMLLSALNVSVDQNRFLDADNNTRLELIYQVAYDQLDFQRTELGFEAELQVEVILEKNGKIVYQSPFTNKIITREFDKTISTIDYKDKVSLTLNKSGFIVKLMFTDPNKGESAAWSEAFEILPIKSLISDLEICEKVVEDTSGYRANLHRSNMLFDASANHVINKELGKFVLYYELYNVALDKKGMSNLEETITISKDSEVLFTNTQNVVKSAQTIGRLKSIDISKYAEGLHFIKLEVKDNISKVETEVNEIFVIKDKPLSRFRIFTSLEDEHKLIKYFISSSKSIWKDLDEKGKRNYIEKFWHSNDPTPDTETNEFFEQVLERVKVANQRYKAFAEGWDTDMGRIYIRHGQPDEIIRASTGLETKYAEKDYEIWKYRTNKQMTFVLIDIQNSNKYKLIFSENDPNESSNPAWADYLGSDFDESVLE